ncbi:aldehyde dehydrogenase [Streptomyces hygroscopicus]|uniref:aldehyde dehydrogenase n=1 Tax=Streptomyces hygroscopicus TaxID=1912 RepID=UPI000783AC80|nr:aldehyde dehydrogenase [Streptomyces hygroscopicus]
MTHNYSSLFIGGQWASPHSAEVNTVVCASTEEVYGHTPLADAHDIDTAVAAARRAFDDTRWSSLVPAERADAMERFADELEARAASLAETVTAANGMPYSLSVPVNGSSGAAILRYYADLIRKFPMEELRTGTSEGGTLVRREPLGVVAAMVPWNYPQTLAMMKIAPALAAGCTVVLKPALETALDANIMAEAADAAGLPPGVLNVVPGGREAGEALVAHPGVDKVAFTGSTPVGRTIGEVCGRLLRPVTLELGGKSAAIVLDDADLATTAAGLASVSFPNNGQTCYASTRILAPSHRYAKVLDAVTDMAKGLPVGDPFDAATAIGPVVSARQRERIEGYIAAGRNEGARLTTGGKRPAHLERGWFVEPTVFGDVANDMVIAREEIFGPVVVVIPYRDESEAVALANDSEYGLGGSIWTADVERGTALARQINTGTVGVNGYQLDFDAPFGGVKASGLGRELGPEGLSAYIQLKSVYLPKTA